MRVWAKDEPFGAELVDVTLNGTTLAASGLAICTEPAPYRLEYQLVTAERYVTTRLAARTEGPGWRRALVLERAASGFWTCTGQSAQLLGSDASDPVRVRIVLGRAHRQRVCAEVSVGPPLDDVPGVPESAYVQFLERPPPPHPAVVQPHGN
jgi:hypothetical protein